MKKYLIFLLLAFGFLLFTIISNAQTTCPTGTQATGLISSSQPVEGLGNPGGNCAVDASKIAFAPFKIPTYDDLKSLYFTQSKATKTSYTPSGPEADQDNINALFPTYDVIHITKELRVREGRTINEPNKPVVIFVEGFLAVDSNIAHTNNNSGLVFIVKGDVKIFKDVTRIDAVIISQGTICSAFDGSSCPAANINTSQLEIRGSLISLDPNKPLKSVRSLNDNTQPAEKIVWQSKYLVILRNLLSDTYQKWSEIQ